MDTKAETAERPASRRARLKSDAAGLPASAADDPLRLLGSLDAAETTNRRSEPLLADRSREK